MQTGDRKWASTRRGGMTVLGKVTAPKPINLPSQRLENHGQNRDVEIVPKGTVSWGSKSSSTPNAWGTSPPSLNVDGALSPLHVGHPSSGGNSTRPSTAGSEVSHEHTNAWSANSRPSSASGSLTSTQNCAVSLRPHSAETRANIIQLSRFAEPSTDLTPAWNANAIVKGTSLSSKKDRFTLSSGDFPSLGLEKESSGRNIEDQDSVAQDLPNASFGETHISPGTFGDSLDTSLHANANGSREKIAFGRGDGIRPSNEKWQAEPQPYPGFGNHIHYEGWRGPNPDNHPSGVWFGPPPEGPTFGPPVASAGFSVEPFSYYRPQIGPLTNPRPILGGSGAREMHPAMKDTYRPHMHDAFGRPAIAIRPGFYPGPGPGPGPGPYDGYYGPPMAYANPSDCEVASMGRPVRPSTFNRFPAPFSHDIENSRNMAGFSTGSKSMNVEAMDSVCIHDTNFCNPSTHGKHVFPVLAQEGEEGTHMKLRVNPENDGNASEMNGKSVSTYPEGENSIARRENWKLDSHKIEDVDNQKVMPSEVSSTDSHVKKLSMKLKSPRTHQRIDTDSHRLPHHLETYKERNLIQKLDGINAKVRAPEVLGDAKSVVSMEEQQSVEAGDIKAVSKDSGFSVLKPISRNPSAKASGDTVTRILNQQMHGRSDNPETGRADNKIVDALHENDLAVDSLTEDSKLPMADPSETQIQRATMLELAKIRLRQREKEEEERSRDQKAKALAKLEELNRRTQVEGLAKLENVPSADPNKQVESMNIIKQHSTSSVANRNSESLLGPKPKAPMNISEGSTKTSSDALLELPKSVNEEPVAVQVQSRASNKQVETFRRKGLQKGMGHMKKQSEKTEGPNVTGNATVYFGGVAVEISPCSDSSSPVTSRVLNETLMPDKKPRIGKSSQTVETSAILEEEKVSLELTTQDASVSNARLKTPEYDLDPASLQPSSHSLRKNEQKLKDDDANPRISHQSKSQSSRKIHRNGQSNRGTDKLHNSESVVWAPLQSHAKSEVMVDASSKKVAEDSSQTHQNQRHKRAEIERYVPKQVATEMHQESREENAEGPIPHVTDADILQTSSAKLSSTSEMKHGDAKHSKPGKTYGAWRKRGSTELSGSSASLEQRKDPQKSSEHSEHIYVQPLDEANSCDDRTMPKHPVEQRDQSRGRKQADKGHLASGYGRESVDRKTNGVDFTGGVRQSNSLLHQVDTSKDKRSTLDHSVTHWQPKTQSQPVSQQVKKCSDSNRKVSDMDLQPQPEKEKSLEQSSSQKVSGNQEGRMDRKSIGPGRRESTFSDVNNQHEHDKGYKQSRERYRPNSHYEYQPVGTNIVETQSQHNPVSKSKEKSSSYSRRAPGYHYGRRPVAVNADGGEK